MHPFPSLLFTGSVPGSDSLAVLRCSGFVLLELAPVRHAQRRLVHDWGEGQLRVTAGESGGGGGSQLLQGQMKFHSLALHVNCFLSS